MAAQSGSSTARAASATQVRNAAVTAGFCAPLSLIRSFTMVFGIVVALWAFTSGGAAGADLSAATRVAVAAWLAAFGAHIDFAGGTWALLPTGITAITAWAAYRAARRGLRDLHKLTTVDGIWFLTLFGLTHAGGIVLVSWWASHDGIALNVGQAAIAATVFSVAIAIWAAASKDGAAVFAINISAVVRTTWQFVRTSLAALVIIAAVCVGVALVAGWAEVSALLADYSESPAVAAGLWASSAAIAPTVCGWFLALLVGAPVQLGSHHLSVLGGSLGPLPPTPLMMAMPQHLPSWAWVALLVSVLTFAVTAWRVTTENQLTANASAGFVVMAAVMTSVLGTAAAFLLSGTIGYPRWHVVGPSWWAGLALGTLCALGSAVGTWWSLRTVTDQSSVDA